MFLLLQSIKQQNAPFLINILIFLCLLRVSKPSVHLQEGCMYRYGVVEDEPLVSKYVEDIKKFKIKILIY
jgi:hypothetical protein